ncbi:MAG: FecR domain-containing protein [Myxococcales bacterium]|nr:FecR domain-containing protein [Myxococcales bacterium]
MAERPIDAELTPALDEAELAQVWRRVRDAQAERRVAPRRWRYAIATGVAVATAAVLLLAWPRDHRAAGALAGDVALTPGAQIDATAARAIAMADGSRVTLAPEARLEVLANEGDKFVTAVRRGKVGFDVRPGGPRKWIIETDLATVEVVGTAFAVERSAVELSVTVERGVVLVRGERVPGRVVRLTAGQHVEVAAAIATAPTAPSVVDGASPPAPIAPPVAPAIDRAPPVAPAIDRAPPVAPAIDRAPIDRAPPPVAPAIDRTPPVVPPPVAPPVDIIARADALVAAGQHARAADALDAYLADARGDATAGLAAFLLGRLAQDHLAQPQRAADAFARVRAIGTPRAIQEEALVRQTRALTRAGRTVDARAAARTYLDQYPGGARAAEMTALTAP